MNLSNYPKPQILLRQDSVCGITWRGYLTRATLLAIGFGSYILLTKKIDLGENGKRCFYAVRKYFPRGKELDKNDKDPKPCAIEYNNPESTAIIKCRNQTTQSVRHRVEGGGDDKPNPCKFRNSYLFATWCDKGNYLGRSFIAWMILALALVTAKFKVIPWWEFIGHGSIFDFLMPLVVMPTIYIWIMYRDSLTIRRE